MQVFDEDYAFFYEHRLTAERTGRDVDLIWRLLQMDGDETVLDVPCGSGRIANRLAERGCSVVGVDANPAYIERARTDAAALGVDIDYRVGDMRDLEFEERFDVAINWFTSFGYFDHAGNMSTLRGLRKSLRPGGRLLLDTLSREGFTRRIPSDQDESVQVMEIGDDIMVDRWRLDAVEGRCVIHRLTVRNGRVRRVDFSIRLPTFSEARLWLTEAGFDSVDVSDETGMSYSVRSHRMVLVARR